ncbi:hypothetical protein [Streptomyces beijiangensis]|uniref:Uncharacterized protein n=1 Tax=Streptomyces beijiangensis TaxID=163361 RepID=A0A939F2X5_9ACTN|nr:hypothetical protein [Streptomyces beijiangensis]MBO0511566.1 hypothetical protein [Streptomyces beijiangensis]
MSPIIRVDVGWVLHVQASVAPLNVPIDDWGALGYMADRHMFERENGVLYYEEPSVRAATFLHTALLLRPFSDFNMVIGWSCAEMYMISSERPLAVKPADVHALTGQVRAQEIGLRDVARTIESWRISA